MVEQILQTCGRPIAIRDYLFPSILNIKSSLLFGKRYSPEDPKFKALQDMVEAWSSRLKTVLQMSALPPWAEELISMNPYTTKGALRRIVQKLMSFSRLFISDLNPSSR